VFGDHKTALCRDAWPLGREQLDGWILEVAKGGLPNLLDPYLESSFTRLGHVWNRLAMCHPRPSLSATQQRT
jgi:hypothetical protein